MKASVLSSLLLAAVSQAHTIFQKVSVDGTDKGYLTALRAPSVNNPIMSATDANIACNTGLHTPISSEVISIPAGSKVGAYWQHVLGGAQFTNDPDNPIAKSHKGPIQAYLAKVDNAATTGTTGLQWFKIASDGLDNTSGTWGVDNMLANNGWSYFTMPTCIAAGSYLLRVEIIALHSAYTAGQAQFYMSCAQINVTGGGSFTPASTVSFPGAYTTNDPGILLNIYSKDIPDNGGKPYTPPGPAVIQCSS